MHTSVIYIIQHVIYIYMYVYVYVYVYITHVNSIDDMENGKIYDTGIIHNIILTIYVLLLC